LSVNRGKPNGPLELDRDDPINQQCVFFCPMQEKTGFRAGDLVNPGFADIALNAGHSWGRDAFGDYTVGNNDNPAVGADHPLYDRQGDGTRDEAFSVLLLINRQAHTGQEDLFSKTGLTGSDLEWFVALNGGGRIFLRLTNFNQSGQHITARDQSALTTGGLNHVVFTYNGSRAYSGFTFYRDGVLTSTDDASGGTFTGLVNGDSPISLHGTNAASSGNNSAQRIYQARFWRRVVHPGEVRRLYNNPWVGCRTKD